MYLEDNLWLFSNKFVKINRTVLGLITVIMVINIIKTMMMLAMMLDLTNKTIRWKLKIIIIRGKITNRNILLSVYRLVIILVWYIKKKYKLGLAWYLNFKEFMCKLLKLHSRLVTIMRMEKILKTVTRLRNNQNNNFIIKSNYRTLKVKFKSKISPSQNKP